MRKLPLRTVRIYLDDSCFARCGPNADDGFIALGPIEGCVVGKLVAQAKLLVFHFLILIFFNLTESQTVCRDVNNQEPG